MGRSGPVLATGTVVLGALALTESFRELPAAVAAYVAAWWVLGLDWQSRPRSGEPG